MIVHDLYIGRSRSTRRPLEANPPLKIYSDAPLALTGAVKGFQAVRRQTPQIVEPGCRLQDYQPFLGLLAKCFELPDEATFGIDPGALVPVADNRARVITGEIWDVGRPASTAYEPLICLKRGSGESDRFRRAIRGMTRPGSVGSNQRRPEGVHGANELCLPRPEEPG